MKRYIVVTSADTTLLASKVERHLAEGWDCLGGVALINPQARIKGQAMVHPLTEEEEEEEEKIDTNESVSKWAREDWSQCPNNHGFTVWLPAYTTYPRIHYMRLATPDDNDLPTCLPWHRRPW
jgi:hypothetical protein